MFFFLSTLLRILAASILFVAAQTEITTDDLYGKISSTAAPPGYNIDGGSVFTNFVNAFNNKQFFFIRTGTNVYEKPATEPIRGSVIAWCSDLTFSDLSNSSLMGYAARCVGKFLTGYVEALHQELRELLSIQKDILQRQWAYLPYMWSSKISLKAKFMRMLMTG
jgi:hypothetical protein